MKALLILLVVFIACAPLPGAAPMPTPPAGRPDVGEHPPAGEDGYDLWLRYRLVADEARLSEYRASLASVVVADGSATLVAAHDELVTGLEGLLGKSIRNETDVRAGGMVVAGTPRSSPFIASLGLAELAGAGDEGFVIRAVGGKAIAIAANRDIGVLYGVFCFLRHLEMARSLVGIAMASAPRIKARILDHWDNLDRTVERGYAGASLWEWERLPASISPRYRDYARANASIGINGAVLTNVNADAKILTPRYLEKAGALAAVLRPYGIRIYLTARFTAPIEIGGLKTADPLDAGVRQWWRDKSDEIYLAIPDFGGFLVKAGSEGQPGPADYGRSHADGANMLADAVAPHGGIVMWRAFVYSEKVAADRVTQAYDEFKPLDGLFRDNVMLQVKNGPLDFQPREPFHPLFGAMPKTPLMLELQITKEYLGADTHLVFLGPLFEETLHSDTYALGRGSTVAKVVDGTLHGYGRTGIAGVANVGMDRNWCGSHFNQANWYAFGRFAWAPEISAAEVAEEWARATFSNDDAVVKTIVAMMLASREAAVDYMTPLGLAHLMGARHHYGPAPWFSRGRADWTPVYYHRADANGIGFDRTPNAVAQYFGPVRDRFANRETVPDSLLLWFHHVRWDERMRSGKSLWEELCARYQRGVDGVRSMRQSWQALRSKIDATRFADVNGFLLIQEKEARWWRDASTQYFQTFSRMPFPAG